MTGEPMTDHRTMQEALTALDTADGCLMLVAEGIRITDLAECRAEIQAAQLALTTALGYRDDATSR